MTLLLLIVFVVIATLFWVVKWRRTGQALYAVAIVVFLAIGFGPVPDVLLSNLQAPYVEKPEIEWEEHNVIVLLGAGTERIGHTNIVEPGTFSYSRIFETGALYHACRKHSEGCRIIVSGGDTRGTGMTEAAAYRESLLQIGVNAHDIMIDPKSVNTFQNAEFTSRILKAYDASRIILVTSGIHMRRAVLYFSHFKVPVTPVRADYLVARMSILPLAYNFAVNDFALHEYIGILRYPAYEALGWNAPKAAEVDDV